MRPASSVAPTVCAPLDAAARHPHGEAGGVVIAAAAASLANGRPAELAPPDDQRVFEQARALQVGQERGHGLVGHAAHLFVVGVDVVVGVPLHGDRTAAGIKLDEPDRRARPACAPAGSGCRTRRSGVVQAVQGLGRLRIRVTGRQPRARRSASGTPARSWRSGPTARCRPGRDLARSSTAAGRACRAARRERDTRRAASRLTIGAGPLRNSVPW